MAQAFGLATALFGWKFYWQPMGGKQTDKHVWIPFAMIGVFEMAVASTGLFAPTPWLWDMFTSGIIPF